MGSDQIKVLHTKKVRNPGEKRGVDQTGRIHFGGNIGTRGCKEDFIASLLRHKNRSKGRIDRG